MTVSILLPVGGADCEHRRRARDWIAARYRQKHPDWPLICGESDETWSKGAAVADAAQRATGDVLVIADADSYVEPAVLVDAVRWCEAGRPWVVPHWKVYRLTPEATENVYAGHPADLAALVRPAYTGPPGGGITVLTRDAYDTVDGIDPRFYGWGGEDLAFGWALHALTGKPIRLTGSLVHLWHPHPAPDLRGSPESERLVARYKGLRNHPAGIRQLIEERNRGPSTPAAAHRDSHPG